MKLLKFPYCPPSPSFHSPTLSPSLIFLSSPPSLLSLPLLSSSLRGLAHSKIRMPSREYKWTNMKGLKYHLTTNQRHVRNYVFNQAKKMVMKQTNGLYPAPLKIMEVCGWGWVWVLPFSWEMWISLHCVSGTGCCMVCRKEMSVEKGEMNCEGCVCVCVKLCRCH